MIPVLRHMIGKDDATIIEIGSCEGEHSAQFLQQFENVRLFCFEPDPKNCNDFSNRIQDGRCNLIRAAVCDKDGTVIFHRSGGRPRRASGSINTPKDHLTRHPWCTFDEDIEVLSVTLDSWCKEHEIKSIDLIWADVNGAERKMILGAQEVLKFTKYLYTEFGPDDAEIYEGGVTKQELLSLLPNFEEVMVDQNNVLLRNKELTSA